MKLLKERDNNGFFTVSNAFVDSFLGVLSGNAVKLFLYIKKCLNEGNEFYPSDACSSLRITGDECGSALEELELGGILVTDGDSLILKADSTLRDAAADRDNAGLKRKLSDNGWSNEFKEVVTSINDEFFAGRMSPKWYDLIKKCAGEYGFSPETIYILFVSCKNIREKTGGTGFYNYVAKVAENWYAEKVVTPEDVDAREKRAVAAREYVGFVMKKLNFKRPFTAQEQSVIEGWLRSGVTEEMLTVLLDDTNRVKAFTISRIDSEVNKWLAGGLRTGDDVTKYYEALRAERTAERRSGQKEAQSGADRKNDNRGHFKGERDYDEDFFKWLESRDAKSGTDGAPIGGKND
ncbi:MAG: DnaD domain protein [Clostridia bacterium]|nr:DnaD domain protein [Clostridia bacterium]